MHSRESRIKHLFLEAAELPTEERSRFLDRECGDNTELRSRVESLLEHDAMDTMEMLRTPAFDVESVVTEAEAVPETIGRFRVIRKIGEGGMGTVYQAEQDSPRRIVALKAIRIGNTSGSMLRRFEHEAQILGRLRHPGIAHIYEAGVADAGEGAQPYFAMEFVVGRPLLEHMNHARLGTRERLAMLADVCDAVEHAHQKGVIHRDLKPANILVDETNQPKVLDFGVARATDSDVQATTLRTNVGQLIGTIPYMSPEQTAADPLALDTRSDVYALGVLAYEMLVGKLPYDLERKAIIEAARVIQQVEPERLSVTDRRLRGDIETIVAKALEKAPARRYQSAAAFADDIRRYLADEPITARPPSALYQLRKFSSRNRWLVGSGLAVFVAVIAGAAVSVAFAMSEADARRIAQTQASRARLVTTFLTDMLRQVEPSEAQGEDVTVREVLDASAAGIGEAFDGEAEVESAIRYTIGSAYVHLGVYDQAEPMLQRSLDLRRRELEFESLDTVNVLNDLGTLRIAQGRHQEALQLHEEAATLSEAAEGPDSIVTLSTVEHMGNALRELGRYDEAKDLLHKVLEGRLQVHGPDHVQIAYARHNLGVVFIGLGDYSAAESTLSDALTGIRKHHGNRHPRTASALRNLSFAMTSNGRFKEAEPIARECVEVNKLLFGDDHPQIAGALGKQAKVLQALGRYVEAEHAAREAIKIQEQVTGADPIAVARFWILLASQLYHQDRLEESEQLQRRGVAFFESLPDADSEEHAWAIHALTKNLVKQGRFDEAEPLQRNAVRMMRRALGEDHPSVTVVLSNLGNIAHRKGDLEASAQITQEVYESQARMLGEDHPEVTVAMMNLGVVQWKAGDMISAEKLVRDALGRFRKERGDDHPHVTFAMRQLAVICRDLGNVDESIDLLTDVLDRTRAQFGDEHQRVAAVEGKLGEALSQRGDFEQAETLLLSSHALLSRTLDVDDSRVADAMQRLVVLYEAWGRPDDAAKWRRSK